MCFIQQNNSTLRKNNRLEITRNQNLSSFHAFIASRINHSCYMKRNVGTRSVHQIMFSMRYGVGWRGAEGVRGGEGRDRCPSLEPCSVAATASVTSQGCNLPLTTVTLKYIFARKNIYLLSKKVQNTTCIYCYAQNLRKLRNKRKVNILKQVLEHCLLIDCYFYLQ